MKGERYERAVSMVHESDVDVDAVGQTGRVESTMLSPVGMFFFTRIN